MIHRPPKRSYRLRIMKFWGLVHYWNFFRIGRIRKEIRVWQDASTLKDNAGKKLQAFLLNFRIYI
jgi:hypothetical protein